MSQQYYIPGPGNEIVPAVPRDDTLRFPVVADTASYAYTASFLAGYIESASYAKYAETASFSLGFILSASYARYAATASYLLGSVTTAISCSWAALAGHALTADTASYAYTSSVSNNSNISVSSSFSQHSVTSSYSLFSGTTISASYSNKSNQSDTASYLSGTASYSLTSSTASYTQNSATASYLNTSTISLTVSGSSNSQITTYWVTDISTPTIIDLFPTTSGTAAKWFLSISDGTSFKASEILSIWNPATNTTNFAEVTTNTIGTIPVAMSVSLSGGMVRLIANPPYGTWTIKFIRFSL